MNSTVIMWMNRYFVFFTSSQVLMDLTGLLMYHICFQNLLLFGWHTSAYTHTHTHSIDIPALKSFQKAFITSMFTTVEGLRRWRWTRRKRRVGDERSNRRWINKTKLCHFPKRLFLSHPAITSSSISMSAFWLIRSNGVFVCVCVF